MKINYRIHLGGLLCFLLLAVASSPATERPSWAIDDSWDIAPGVKITSFINGEGYQLLAVDELASFALNAGQYVRQVKIEDKVRAAVFLIYRSTPSKIGETNSYPLVMLLVGRSERDILPSSILYEWESWDLRAEKLVKRFEADTKKPFVEEPRKSGNQ